jgi:hypothetical protein
MNILSVHPNACFTSETSENIMMRGCNGVYTKSVGIHFILDLTGPLEFLIYIMLNINFLNTSSLYTQLAQDAFMVTLSCKIFLDD